MADDKGTEPTTTETTEDKPLGAAGEKALKERTEALRRAESENAELKKWKAARELDDLRASVASEKGLTTEMADALAGSTQEELELHADKLKALLPKPNPLGRPKEALRLSPGASNIDDDETVTPEQAAKAADDYFGS